MSEGSIDKPGETTLLEASDPAPVTVLNAQGRSPFLLVADHAGSAIPKKLGDLGVSAADRARHIACDLGIRALGEALSQRLDAMLIEQHYSRLVIDCNRDPARADAVPVVSDGTDIPGNRIDEVERARRIGEIHRPYHEAIGAAIDDRTARGEPVILIALHSFTPVMQDFTRPWHAGVLHHRGRTGFALRVLDRLRVTSGLTVGDNEPYEMDGTDFTIPHHAYARKLDYAELEIRQDLLALEAGVSHWAALIGQVLEEAQ